MLFVTLSILAATTLAAPSRDPEPRALREPARVTIYPLSQRREGEWRLQRIALSGAFLSSLGATLNEALPDSVLDARQRRVMAWDIAGLLRWDVDFARGLDDGDEYSIVFERFISDDGEIRYGRLLAAELVVNRRTVSVFAFAPSPVVMSREKVTSHSFVSILKSKSA